MTTQKFKYVPKVSTRSGKFFHTSGKELLKFIQANEVGYEVLDGAVVPYYDYDKSFDSENDQKTGWESEIRDAYQIVKTKFPDGNIFTFDSSGFNNTKKKYVNSFHFIVRNVGYYESGKAMHEAVGLDWDASVYKDIGKRQLFRMAYCSKEADDKTRPFKRVFIDMRIRLAPLIRSIK
jgi:hypothetical protein